MEVAVLFPDLELNIEMTNSQPAELLKVGDGVMASWHVP